MHDVDYQIVADLFQLKLFEAVRTVDACVLLNKCEEGSLIWTGSAFEPVICGYILYAGSKSLREIINNDNFIEGTKHLVSANPYVSLHRIEVDVPSPFAIGMFVGLTKENQ